MSRTILSEQDAAEARLKTVVKALNASPPPAPIFRSDSTLDPRFLAWARKLGVHLGYVIDGDVETIIRQAAKFSRNR